MGLISAVVNSNTLLYLKKIKNTTAHTHIFLLNDIIAFCDVSLKLPGSKRGLSLNYVRRFNREKTNTTRGHDGLSFD